LDRVAAKPALSVHLAGDSYMVWFSALDAVVLLAFFATDHVGLVWMNLKDTIAYTNNEFCIFRNLNIFTPLPNFLPLFGPFNPKYILSINIFAACETLCQQFGISNFLKALGVVSMTALCKLTFAEGALAMLTHRFHLFLDFFFLDLFDYLFGY